MNMPVIIDIPDETNPLIFQTLFEYFRRIDDTFSPFKETSEVSKFNAGKSTNNPDLLKILSLADQTKHNTHGYFDIRSGSKIDPSGIVKGWAIHNAAEQLRKKNVKRFYVEAGGDIEVGGNTPWRIGIRNPFNVREIVKIVELKNGGIATSGTYERGNHIYNPFTHIPVDEILSLTVIGPDIYEADRFATAAFAMGRTGIQFIETLKGFEGYMINAKGTATLTSGFGKYVV